MINDVLETIEWEKVVDNAIDFLAEWAEKAWNWIQNFFTYVYEHIDEWARVISLWLDEVMRELERQGYDTTGIVTNPAYEKGRQIIDILKNGGGDKIQLGDNGNVAMSMGNGQIGKVATFNADVVENPNAFNQYMQEKDGVIVIKN